MGGGGQTTVTSPQLPPELRELYQTVSDQLITHMGGMPLGDYYEMPERQFADLSPLEQMAMGLAPGMLGPSAAGTAAFDMASQLGQPSPWGGVDLGQLPGYGWQPQLPEPRRPTGRVTPDQPGGSKVGRVTPDTATAPAPRGAGEGGFGYITGTGTAGGMPTPGMGAGPTPWGGSAPIPGMQQYGLDFSQGGAAGNLPPRETGVQMPDQPGAFQQPGRVANPLQSIDFANHPALQSAMSAFEETVLPGIANQMTSMGLGRSGAAGEAVAKGKAQMALPVMQQLMGLEMQGMGMDIGQRGQDIQAGLGQRGQDIGMRAGDIQSLLAGRGQDVTQRGQDIGSLMNQMGYGLQARGQDIGALLQQGSQGLQARGQDIGALLQQGAQGLQARGQDIGSLQAGMAGMTGLSAQDQQRYMDALNQMTGLGGRERSIQDARFGATADELARQYGLSRDLLFGPIGQLTSQIGQHSRTTGGGK